MKIKIPTLSSWLTISDSIRATLRAVMSAKNEAATKGQQALADYWQTHWCRLYDGAEAFANRHAAVL